MDPALLRPLFGVGAVAVGLAAIVGNWHNGRKVVSSQSWPSVTGTVVSSRVTVHRHGSDRRIYQARVEYEYEVDGRTYRGDRVCVGGELDTSSRGRAEARCAAYPVGAVVEVFHDPHLPEQACLERTREGAWLMTLVGNGFLLFGLLLITGMLDSPG